MLIEGGGMSNVGVPIGRLQIFDLEEIRIRAKRGSAIWPI
jgi:hypothetical protein